MRSVCKIFCVLSVRKIFWVRSTFVRSVVWSVCKNCSVRSVELFWNTIVVANHQVTNSEREQMIEFCHGLELDLFGIDGGVRVGVGGVGLKVGLGLECVFRFRVGRGHGQGQTRGSELSSATDLVGLRI